MWHRRLKQPSSLQQLSMTAIGEFVWAKSVEVELLRQSKDPGKAGFLLDALKKLIEHCPLSILEELLAQFLSTVVDSYSRNRCGFDESKRCFLALPTALNCLWPPSLSNVDFASLYRFCLRGLEARFDNEFRVILGTKMQALWVASISKGTNLRVLKLERLATDDILHLLCRHAPGLEELDASFSEISDEGLKLFCKPFPLGVHGCPELTAISFTGCRKLTASGVAEVLRNARNLKRLISDLFVEALEVLAQSWPAEGQESKRTFKLKILEIYLESVDVSPGVTDILMDHMPEVEHVNFLIPGEAPLAWLARFHRLKTVEVVTLGRRSSSELKDVFCQFLAVRGPNLVCLVLFNAQLPVESIIAIGQHCKNLKRFVNKDGGCKTPVAGHVLGSLPVKSGAFRNLEDLCVKIERGGKFGEEKFLYYVSEARMIRRIGLYGRLDFVNDGFWLNLLQNINGLHLLESLDLFDCSHEPVAGSLVNAFSATTSKLRRLRDIMRSCGVDVKELLFKGVEIDG